MNFLVLILHALSAMVIAARLCSQVIGCVVFVPSLLFRSPAPFSLSRVFFPQSAQLRRRFYTGPPKENAGGSRRRAWVDVYTFFSPPWF